MRQENGRRRGNPRTAELNLNLEVASLIQKTMCAGFSDTLFLPSNVSTSALHAQ